MPSDTRNFLDKMAQEMREHVLAELMKPNPLVDSLRRQELQKLMDMTPEARIEYAMKRHDAMIRDQIMQEIHDKLFPTTRYCDCDEY